MHRPENGFRELPRLTHHAGSLACFLINVVDDLPDHTLPEEFRLQLTSVEWTGLRCLLYTAVVGETSPKIHVGKPHVVVQVRFDRPIWLRMYFYVVYSRPVCLACQDAVDALEVASAFPDDAVVIVRDAAFALAEERVRDSELIVCGSTSVYRCRSTYHIHMHRVPHHLPFSLLLSSRRYVCSRPSAQNEIPFLVSVHQAVDPMPESSFLLTVTRFFGCIPYHKVDGFVSTRHLKAHGHQTFVNIFPGEL